MEKNKIVQDLSNRKIIVDEKYYFVEDSKFNPSNPKVSNINVPTQYLSTIDMYISIRVNEYICISLSM